MCIGREEVWAGRRTCGQEEKKCGQERIHPTPEASACCCFSCTALCRDVSGK